MRAELRQILLSTAIVCMSATTIYAQPMTLRYDGAVHAYNEPPIELYVNDVRIENMPMPPIQLNGRTLVPVREICEPLGANVEYKANERKIYIDYHGDLIILEPDNQEVWMNGTTITLDVPAKIVNDKIMVPVRFVGEALGGVVEWVGGNPRIVYIDKEIKGPEVEVPDKEEPDKEEPDKEEPDKEEPDKEEPDTEEPDKEEPDKEEPDKEEPDTEEDLDKEEPDTEEDLDKEDPDTEEDLDKEDPETEEDLDKEDPDAEEDLDEEDDLMDELFEGAEEYYKGEGNQIDTDIDYETNSKTQITSVDVYASGRIADIVISAEEAITDVMIDKDKGKLIVDVLNSQSELDSEIQVEDNPYFYNIRTSQFTPDTTRIVFDLKSGVSVEASLSDDRQAIELTLDRQALEGVIFGHVNGVDYIAIENFAEDQVWMQDYRRSRDLLITLPNTQLDEAIEWRNLNGEFIEAISVEEQGSDVVMEVVLQEGSDYIHEMLTQDGYLVIKFHSPSFSNIKYINDTNKVIEIKQPEGLDLEDITIHDHYKDYELIIDLGKNYEDHFGEGVLPIDDTMLSGITIETNGTTQIRIDQKLIHTVELKEEDGVITIELVRPQDKYDQIVLIDIGHGGTDPGAIDNGVQEKALNTKQAEAVIRKLEQQTDIKVYTTRDDDTTLTLQYRSQIANDIGADIFISIHNNSVSSSTVSGTEVLYFPDANDMRGKKMAEITQDYLIEALGSVDRGIKARDGLYVLKTTHMPAILIEGGFISNKAEAAALNSERGIEAYGQAVADAIVEIFDTLSFR